MAISSPCHPYIWSTTVLHDTKQTWLEGTFFLLSNGYKKQGDWAYKKVTCMQDSNITAMTSLSTYPPLKMTETPSKEGIDRDGRG